MTSTLDLPVAGPVSPLLNIPGLKVPAFASLPEYHDTLGDEAIGFCTDIGYIPDPQQELALNIIFARDKRGKSAAYETGIVVSRQNMKCLDASTPMLTTRGWTTMGEIQAGDQVYHPGGYPVTVTRVSVPELAHSCYRVTTTDGRSLVADSQHLWQVTDTRTRQTRLVTTAEMAAGVDRYDGTRTSTCGGKTYATREYRWQLPVQEPVKTPDVVLPVDPYLLGAWLGDGRTGGAALWSHENDVPHWLDAIRQAGFTPVPARRPTAWEIGITWPGPGAHSSSLRSRLRQLGMLGSKHVPDLYLAAGTGQRLALLQGLLDTDGTIHHKSGQVTFTSVLRPLADAVLFLCRSLGWRAGFREGRAILDGRDCGPMFTVTFTPKTTDPFMPFRLPRKAARVRDTGRAGRFTVSVKSVDPAPTRPVRCIAVDAPDGLYLAGRDLVATHNTGIFKMAALCWLYLFDEELVVWSAHEFATVEETENDLENMILNNDKLRKATARVIHANGKESIETIWGARIMFRTRTKTGGRGLSANKVILDESFALHSKHMGALLPTMSAKRDPQILYGSSACLEDSDILAELIERGRPGADRDWVTAEPLHQVVAGPMATAYLEWCAPPPKLICREGEKCSHAKPKPGLPDLGCGCDNPRWWGRANPTMGITRADGTGITEDYVRGERKAMPVGEFIRERMGWHDKVTEGINPMPMNDWYGCGDKKTTPRPGSPLAIGFAVAPDSSSAAVALAGWRADGLPHGELIEHLPGAGWLLEFLLGVVERRSPCVTVMDPAGPTGAFEKLLRQPRGPEGQKTCFVTAPKDNPDPPRLMPGQRLLMVTSAREYAQGTGMLVNAVIDGNFRHPDQRPLNDAARWATKRNVAQAWVWDAPDGKDITPIQAVTQAQLGLATFGAKTALTPFALT